MSQQRVEVIRGALRALFEQRDVDAFVECFDPDAELLLARNLLEGGSYRGHEGIRRAYADIFETWDDVRFELTGIRTTDDWVVVLGRNMNVGKGEAPTFESESAYSFRTHAGKITYVRPYASHREALEAVGLQKR
jgi:ketosteroid isomerase-like protein